MNISTVIGARSIVTASISPWIIHTITTVSDARTIVTASISQMIVHTTEDWGLIDSIQNAINILEIVIRVPVATWSSSIEIKIAPVCSLMIRNIVGVAHIWDETHQTRLG